MAAYHETHEAPHCPTCDCSTPARDDMSTKPENLDASGERVYGIDTSQVEYDRELIAKMLDELEPVVGLQYIRESVANQARLLRAAADREAAGVHTGRASGAGDWVLVPRVPTPKMIDATWNDAIETSGRVESHNTRNDRIYRAMLDAAPAPGGG